MEAETALLKQARSTLLAMASSVNELCGGFLAFQLVKHATSRFLDL